MKRSCRFNGTGMSYEAAKISQNPSMNTIYDDMNRYAKVGDVVTIAESGVLGESMHDRDAVVIFVNQYFITVRYSKKNKISEQWCESFSVFDVHNGRIILHAAPCA